MIKKHPKKTFPCNIEKWSFSPTPAMKKIYLKMPSTEVVCCMEMLRSRINFGIHTNSVDPDQTAPKEQSDLGPHCLLQRHLKGPAEDTQQKTFSLH